MAKYSTRPPSCPSDAVSDFGHPRRAEAVCAAHGRRLVDRQASDRDAFVRAVASLNGELAARLAEAKQALAQPPSEARSARLTELTDAAEKLSWRRTFWKDG